MISRLPAQADAVRLWDHVVGLASFPGFAELKRSLRERPQLRSLGVAPRGSRDGGGLARRQPTAQALTGPGAEGRFRSQL